MSQRSLSLPHLDARRLALWAAGAGVVAGLVYLMATASTGPTDPTEATVPESHATIVFNSAVIVLCDEPGHDGGGEGEPPPAPPGRGGRRVRLRRLRRALVRRT